MKKLRNGLSVMMLGFALASGTEPARAAVHDCYTAVIDECSCNGGGEHGYTLAPRDDLHRFGHRLRLIGR